MAVGELRQSRLKATLGRWGALVESIAHSIQRYDGDGMEHADFISMRRTAAGLLAHSRNLRQLAKPAETSKGYADQLRR